MVRVSCNMYEVCIMQVTENKIILVNGWKFGFCHYQFFINGACFYIYIKDVFLVDINTPHDTLKHIKRVSFFFLYEKRLLKYYLQKHDFKTLNSPFKLMLK